MNEKMEGQDWELLREDIKPHRQKNAWLISFTDTITLILAFFILIFAMKEPRDNNASLITSPLSGETGTAYSGEQFSGPDKNEGIEKTSVLIARKSFSLNYLEALFHKLLEADPLLSKVEYKRLPSHLVLSMDFNALADVSNEQGQKSLAVLVNTVSRVRNKIEILAIIENSNEWGKATDTSQSIARILKNSGYNRDILISVYGGSENSAFPEALQPGTVNLLISE